MWSQAYNQSQSGISSQTGAPPKRSFLLILPCTVSQLRRASQVGKDNFAFGTWELDQVSVVGVVRGFAPFATFIQCSVDDMTGPPLTVKQWVNSEDCATTFTSGTYVKVIGSLRSLGGQRFLLAMNIRCLKDMNEITSHMLEVVQAHMQHFGKVFDVNINTAVPSMTGTSHPDGVQSPVQAQVLQVIQTSSLFHNEGISLHELKTQLDYLSMTDIRTSLRSLMDQALIFTTIDHKHFKSTDLYRAG